MSESWITWIIQGLTGLAIAAIGYFMKRDRDAIDKKVEKQDNRIDRIERDLRQLPYIYVTREDFLRAITSIETNLKGTENKLDCKLDKVLEKLYVIKDKEDA